MLSAKNFNNNKLSLKILSIILVIVIGIFSVFVYFYKKNKNNNIFKEKEFFVLYIEKNTKQSALLTVQDLVKKLGASGDIYFENDIYYLTACVYISKDDSSQILKSISGEFKNSGVLNLKRKEVPNKNKVNIKNNSTIYNYLLFLDKFTTELCEHQLLFLSGRSTQKALIAFIVSAKIELEGFIDSLSIEKNSSDLFKSIFSSQNLFLLYITNFLNEIFESNNKNSLMCSLTVNVFLNYYDLYKQL